MPQSRPSTTRPWVDATFASTRLDLGEKAAAAAAAEDAGSQPDAGRALGTRIAGPEHTSCSKADLSPERSVLFCRRFTPSAVSCYPAWDSENLRLNTTRECREETLEHFRISPNERGHVISRKVFVGNLSYQSTKEELQALLSAAGTVRDVYLPNDRETGRPRGFAFVEFSNASEAAAAIEQFNEYEFAGRKLRVNPADERPRSRPARPPRSFQSDFGPDDFAEKPAKPKGSRRGVRRRKRSL
jgi:hypothetical protein